MPFLPPQRPKPPPHITRARDQILQRRYQPSLRRKPKRWACLWREDSGRLRMLIGTASASKTPDGVLYNRRVRIVRRFRLSAFIRYE